MVLVSCAGLVRSTFYPKLALGPLVRSDLLTLPADLQAQTSLARESGQVLSLHLRSPL